MHRLVRVILYVLVLAGIGWTVSYIYTDTESRMVTASSVDIAPASVAMAPPPPLAKPWLGADDKKPAPAVKTTLALEQTAPPTPPAKPALDGETAVAASDVQMSQAATEEPPPATFADAGDYVEHGNGETIVDVPTTRVETAGNRNTRVKVRAPYTKVDVDTRRRRVRIRVPYYNGDIRW